MRKKEYKGPRFVKVYSNEDGLLKAIQDQFLKKFEDDVNRRIKEELDKWAGMK